jgi:peptidoglycan/LPS O-acetylase OafA/YrhL
VPAWLDRLAAWPGTCWAAAGALLLLLSSPIAGPLTLAPVPGPEAVLKEASYALFAALLLVPCALGPQRGVLASEPLRFLGRVSYGVFLWHLIVLDVVYRLTGWADFSGRMLAVALLTGLFSVLLGWLSWVLVERPALRLADRVARRSPAGHRGREQAERDRPERLAGGLRPAGVGFEGQQAGQGDRAGRSGSAPAPG